MPKCWVGEYDITVNFHRAEHSGGVAAPQTVEERFKAAAAVLKARDVEDRKSYKDRKRQQAADAKRKKRARQAEDGVAGLGVTLGPGLGFPDQQGRLPGNTLITSSIPTSEKQYACIYFLIFCCG